VPLLYALLRADLLPRLGHLIAVPDVVQLGIHRGAARRRRGVTAPARWGAARDVVHRDPPGLDPGVLLDRLDPTTPVRSARDLPPLAHRPRSGSCRDLPGAGPPHGPLSAAAPAAARAGNRHLRLP